MELDGALCDDDQVPISVAVRVCPPPGRGPHLLPPNICVQVNTVTNELHLGPERRFVYDCVFGPNTCQEDVFATSVEPLLTPLLDGYNVTVAAYGAAGTGKTHTLVGPGPSLGPVVEEESFGLVPRAVRSLFAAVQAQAGSVAAAAVEVEFVEIHNEEIRDLLSETLATVYLDQDGTGATVMPGVTSVRCVDTTEVLACLEMGGSLHHQCRNISNISEPGSHTLFTIKLSQQTVSSTGLTVFKQSKLQFLDLAASDRMTVPGCGGTNLGLLALGNVVSALGDPRRKVAMVPHHDSLLTRVLAPALGGDAVTLLVCCVSALTRDCDETLNTLLTASRAANILNTPVPNIVTQEPVVAEMILPPSQHPMSPPSQHPYMSPPVQHPCMSPPHPPPNHKPYPAPGQPQVPVPSMMSPNHNLYLHPGLQQPVAHNIMSPDQQPSHNYNYYHSPSVPQPPVQNIMSPYTNHNPYLSPPGNMMSPNRNSYLSPGPGPPPPAPALSPATPHTSTSPLSYKSASAPLQLYLPPHLVTTEAGGAGAGEAVMLGNQGHLITGPAHNNLSAPRPASHNLVQDGIIDNEEMFRLQFAASQYKALVSSAGDLLRSISLSAEVEEKKEIDSWICKKEESENVIKKSDTAEKALDKILEESEDDSEAARTGELTSETSDCDDNLETESEETSEASDDSDTDIDVKFEIFSTKFRQRTNLLISNAETYYSNLLRRSIQPILEEAESVKAESSVKDPKAEMDTEASQRVLDTQRQSKEFSIEEDYSKFFGKITNLQQQLHSIENKIVSTQLKSDNVLHLQECLSSLKKQHENLQHRLSCEESRKKELESTVCKDQEVICELHQRLEHQRKLLQDSSEASRNLNAKQEWLKQEEGRIIALRKSAEQLEESVLEKRRFLEDNHTQETSFCQSSKTDLELETIQPLNTSKVRMEVEDLRKIRNIFFVERQRLDDKLNDQQSLSSKEERQLVELDESIEAIDSAIEYKNEIICNKNVSYEKYKGDDLLMKRLVKLNVQETRALLHRYFKRVLDLRMEGKKMEIHLEEVEDQYNDLGKYARELGRSLQRSKLDCERKLMAQHKEYQVKINTLAQQLADQNMEKQSLEYNKKLKSLEKELYRYKNLCKEIKKSQEPGLKHRSGAASVNPAYTRTDEVEAEAGAGAGQESGSSSRPGSVVSHIQPNHIEMFQRRLAKLQRKMGDTAKPTVTREQRKIIIENPVSANTSVEKKSEKHGRRKR